MQKVKFLGKRNQDLNQAHDEDITLQVSNKYHSNNKERFYSTLNDNITDELWNEDIWKTDVSDTSAPLISSLCTAIEHNAHINVIRYWIKAEIKDINKKSVTSQDTALHIAAKKGNLEVVYELLKNGADVSISNSKGQKPLHLAVQSGNLFAAQAVRCNEIDCQDINGQTPLHLAAQLGYQNICIWLLKKGAKMLEDKNYMRPGDLAFDNKHDQIGKYLYKLKADRYIY